MSRNRGSRGRGKPALGDQARGVLENIDESNPVMKMFMECRTELDEKHDRYEKIVKMGRDITIESKRIIFLLHSTNTDIESKRQAVFDEAKTRLNQIVEKNFKEIAVTLKDCDHHLYLKAYTSGMQEFTEAYAFYHFLLSNTIEPWKNISELFKFEEDGEPLLLLYPQFDYILGIGDFTGELMRKCINNLGIGNTSDCFSTCNVVKDIHTGFVGLSYPGLKEIGRKAYTLKQSLAKMEIVCYNLQIRGSEIPKHMLVSVIESKELNNEDDEGFY